MASTLQHDNWIELTIQPGQRASSAVIGEIVRAYWEYALLPGQEAKIHVNGSFSVGDLCYLIDVLEDLVTVSATQSSLLLQVEIDGVSLVVQVDTED